MEKSKREKLEAQGWKIGNAQDFLGLSDEELAYIEVKIALSQQVRQRRQGQAMTQEQVAEQTGSSQSRVAKMEAGDPSVSIDLLVKTLITLGATREELALAIGTEDQVNESGT
ncbi:MAG: helix-turn-helix transcriptional regulator [Anaerolineales bacterium]